MKPTRENFTASDGTNLAVHHMGEGRPLLLLHGLFSSAHMNWIRFGHAEKLANAGYHVIMPDFRVHGQSDGPQDETAYPENILLHDMLALIDQNGWSDFDLGGFSLGSRMAAQLLTRGITPKRALLMGIGWDGIGSWGGRLQFFIDAIDKRDSATENDPHFMAVNFMKSQKIDPVAARLLLKSFGTSSISTLTSLDIPIGVICGAQDKDNGSGEELSDKLANAEYLEIPGTHMSCVTKGDMGDAMLEFLGPARS